jgi:uncharacterized membrane protein YjjP (DUF1212 family)
MWLFCRGVSERYGADALTPPDRSPFASDLTVAPADDRVRFLLEFASALQSYGAAANRLENALETCAEHLGIEGQFFATPTSVFCAFGRQDAQRVHLLRVNAGSVNLRRLTELYQVWGQVLHNRLPARDAAARVRGLTTSPATIPVGLRLPAHALASGTAACFFGGGLREILVATALGLIVGVLLLLRVQRERLDRIVEPIAAFVCALVVTLLAAHSPLARDLTIVAGVVVLVPGFTLTTAMSELAYGHLAAGTARVMGAAITFLSLTVGVALGARIGEKCVPALPPQPVPITPPVWWLALGLVVAALCFVVLFAARKRDTGWILVTCALAFAGARMGSSALGPELGVFVGALLIGLASNLLARSRGTPSAVTTAPALMVLVPGSLGLRSLASLVEGETLLGVRSAFTVLMVAVSLVTGLLVANFLVRARREL